MKESPSVSDYIHFLADLSNESGCNSLNPNELKAVSVILQSIISQKSENSFDFDVSLFGSGKHS